MVSNARGSSTERKRHFAAQGLLLEALRNTSSESVHTKSLDARFLSWNPAAAVLPGFSRDEAMATAIR